MAGAAIGIEQARRERAGEDDEDRTAEAGAEPQGGERTQAMGAMKRRASKMGETMSSSVRNRPMSRPSGTPMAAASR